MYYRSSSFLRSMKDLTRSCSYSPIRETDPTELSSNADTVWRPAASLGVPRFLPTLMARTSIVWIVNFFRDEGANVRQHRRGHILDWHDDVRNRSFGRNPPSSSLRFDGGFCFSGLFVVFVEVDLKSWIWVKRKLYCFENKSVPS